MVEMVEMVVKVPDRPDTAVIGAGTMGVGIAYCLAVSGFSVWVVEPDEDRAETMSREILAMVDGGIAREKLNADDADRVSEAVRRVRTIAEVPLNAELIVESVPERLALKLEVLRQAEARKPRLLATNTSALSINELAASLERPESFIGMHFFNPVPALALVELIRGEHTGDEAMADAHAIVTAIGKQAAVVWDSPGFATSRLDVCLALEAMRMLEEGVAEAEDIDRAVVLAYRHPVGPLRLSDIVGLDVRLDIARNLAEKLGPRFAPPELLTRMVAEGKLGQKTGQGFHRW